MFVRFVPLLVREGQEAAFAAWYRERVIPALSTTHGCVFAGLLTPWRGEEHRSLTIWRNAGAAAAYERSGLYDELLAEAAPMLSSRNEWVERAGREPGAGTDAKIREIATEGFVVDAGDGAQGRLGGEIETAFVRFVSVRVAPDHIGEFVSAYSNRILPRLREQPGFRGGLLAEDRTDEGTCLSITLWDREEDALRYELDVFPGLVQGVKSTFSPIYDWACELAGGGREDPRLDAIQVSSYQLVTGKRLNEQEGRRKK
jgi:heme-degrading monooxygenase HmoA